MSAFTAIFQREGTPVEPGVLSRAMTRLSHRGPDGTGVYLADNLEIGHQHFWTTPEELEEKQPLKLIGLPFVIAFDGRIDNRTKLLAALGIGLEEGTKFSDAALILLTYDQWGARCFEHLIGPFALVLWDEARRELVCARDALGDRTLFYALDSHRMVLASEPWAVLAYPGMSSELDQVSLAYRFAMRAPEDGRTLFQQVRELLPAEVLVISEGGERRWRYWQADASARLRYRSDREYADHFRTLLEESVRCRLRSSAPAGVLMSGGLDSTSVACIAAPMLAPKKLTTISYVFNELTDCDERSYIEAVKTRCGINSIQIECDDAWPLHEWETWPANPNQPEGNPYRLLKERAYSAAHQAGLRVLLTGGFGDQLYSGEQDWLADLVLDGKWWQAGQELVYHLKTPELRWIFSKRFIARQGRHLLDQIPGGWHLRPRPSIPPPVWLTLYAEKLLADNGFGTRSASKPGRMGQMANLLGAWQAQSSSSEIIPASRFEIDLRHPYRDRRLVEFMLAVPTCQLYQHGWYKYILRSAMDGILPEVIRTRPNPTSLAALYERGFARERNRFETVLRNPNSAWRKFVQAEQLDATWRSFMDGKGLATNALLFWMAVAFDRWVSEIQ